MSDLNTASETSQNSAKSRVLKLANIGFWLSTIALGIATLAFAGFLYFAFSATPEIEAELLADFGLESHLQELTAWQMLVGAFFWSWVDLLGLIMLWQIWRLFQGYRQGQIMTVPSAHRLRRIGALLVALPLVNLIGILIGGMLLSAWATGGTLHGQVGIDDSDIYALVVGLVLMAVGHIMALAAEIDAENRAFV